MHQYPMHMVPFVCLGAPQTLHDGSPHHLAWLVDSLATRGALQCDKMPKFHHSVLKVLVGSGGCAMRCSPMYLLGSQHEFQGPFQLGAFGAAGRFVDHHFVKWTRHVNLSVVESLLKLAGH